MEDEFDQARVWQGSSEGVVMEDIIEQEEGFEAENDIMYDMWGYD